MNPAIYIPDLLYFVFSLKILFNVQILLGRSDVSGWGAFIKVNI